MKCIICVSITMLCIGCTESSDKYNLEYDGGYFVDTNGEKLYMINNPNATDPTYDELAVFLKDDVTEDMDEEYPTYVQGSVGIHNKAERNGIRNGVVLFELYNSDEVYACNVFETIDRGTIYIDSSEGQDSIITLDDDYYYPIYQEFGDDEEYEFNMPIIFDSKEICW
jgi:hypothetical protein